MACPAPADFSGCKPKCVCRYSECANIAYDCDDPCGNGYPSTFDPATCSCPTITIQEPALFIDAVELNCNSTTVWNGWWKYRPNNEAQKQRPVSFELGPYLIEPCDASLTDVGSLLVIATWADGSTQRFFGGVNFTQNHNISKELNAWDWGSVRGPNFYQLSIIKTSN